MESPGPKLSTKESVVHDGLNVWHDDGVEAKIDIILVQGLSSNPYYTWVAKGKEDTSSTSAHASSRSSVRALFGRKKSTKENRIQSAQADDFFWPRDLLPKHVGPSRIATYAYRSSWRKERFQTDLRECGSQLVHVLDGYRRTEALRTRPIVFIGHSLGGLVIQQALVLAHESSRFTNIKASTKGALFLGAPMAGTRAADYAAWMALMFRVDRPILDALRPDSTGTSALMDSFCNIYGDLPLVCFYERNTSRYGPLEIKTVDPQSGTMLGKPKIYLPTDHSGLNKFGSDGDEKFKLILPFLRQFVSMALQRPEAIEESRTQSQKEFKEAKKGTMLMPFVRDEKFIGRVDILQQIDTILLNERKAQSRAALFGLGGIGKSQIAIEYAHRVRERDPSIHILWVYANNLASFRKGYEDIAQKISLETRNDGDTDILDRVRQWLADETNGRWLMIVDNVDDSRSVTPKHDGKDPDFLIPRYVPQTPGSLVLTTSRDETAAIGMVSQDSECVVRVECLSFEDTRSLLESRMGKAGSSATEEEKDALIQRLDSIPLAITQAAAYINSRDRATVAKYIDLIDVSEHDLKSVLNIEGGDSRRNPSVPNAVFRTWQITLNLIKEQYPGAADLFATMAMFDRQGIPEFLLDQPTRVIDSDTGQSDEKDVADTDDDDEVLSENSFNTDQSDDDDTTHFNEDIEVLLQYSLVASQENQKTFQMHRLVQLATSHWLLSRRLLQKHREKALRLLHEVYPPGKFEDRAICQALEPHVVELLRHDFTARGVRPSCAQILERQAIFLMNEGRYRESGASLSEALEIYNEIRGETHERSLDCQISLAHLHLRNGRFVLAEQHASQYLHIASDVLGPDHVVSLDLRRILASAYREQGQYEEALPHMEAVVASAKVVLGDSAPDTLIFTRNLAVLYVDLKRYDEAEPMLLTLGEHHRNVYSKDSNEALIILHELGVLYERHGRYVESRELGRHVYDTTKRLLGEDHPDMLMSAINFAASLSQAGQWVEAEAIGRDALRLSSNCYGYIHPNTIMTMEHLSCTLWTLENHAEGLPLRIEAISLSEKVLGVNHPDTKRRCGWFSTKLVECAIKEGDGAKEVLNQTQLQMEPAIKKSYSPGLAECLLTIHFGQCRQLRFSEHGTASAPSMARSECVTSAIKLFLRDTGNRGFNLSVLGKIMGLAGLKEEAVTAFENMLLELDYPEENIDVTEDNTDSEGDEAYGDEESVGEYTESDIEDEYHDAEEYENDGEGVINASDQEIDEKRVGKVGDPEIESAIGQDETCQMKSSRIEDNKDTNEGRNHKKAPQEPVTPGFSGLGSEATRNDDSVYLGRDFKIIEESDGESVYESANGSTEDSEKGVEDGIEGSVEESVAAISMSVGKSKLAYWADAGWCYGCEKSYQNSSRRHFCISCRDVNLCNKCYEKYQSLETFQPARLKDCQNHTFLTAPRTERYNLPWGDVPEDGTSFEEWLKNLLKKLQDNLASLRAQAEV